MIATVLIQLGLHSILFQSHLAHIDITTFSISKEHTIIYKRTTFPLLHFRVHGDPEEDLLERRVADPKTVDVQTVVGLVQVVKQRATLTAPSNTT